MSEARKRISLRRRYADRMVVRSLLVAIAVSVALAGVVAVFASLKHDTDRQAIRDAYVDGRLSRAEAVELLGPAADLPKRQILD